ncbi:inhibitor of nuclear factor kappa-B kinase subunit beta [Nasonia vitripennis]|uniref:IkappaB kinase n=1 Tax=Nasonia vitripennis TaxID=7425 RepID=A0A7M7HBA4_NASVI|nr:inhibitor of nuclear factor kappa-B kinase subunit beta [Nasonia vitripennis]
MAQKSYGNWIYEKMLGAGGFGQVELWKEKYTNKRIAIKKCMLPKGSITDRQMERWKQEIENMKHFNHPNIVKSEQVPPEMVLNSPVLCMEFCNKGDLRKVLSNPENSCGLLQNDALTVMKDISSAVMYLHYNNITHRDLKPDNIVLHEKNGMVVYKLIDLGYAKELGSTTMTASLVGTFNYVAPELFWKQKYTCSVDYWSLGITFFEVISGHKPFQPHIQDLPKWIVYMRQNKTYEQICALEIGEKIKFYDNIIYPNDLSESILNKMVEWFRVVLQWNPRKRGKRPDSDEVVVFPMLREIFPWKTISIFFVSLYRMVQYTVYSNSTFGELQLWIEQQTRIPINRQVIADTAGLVFNRNQNYESINLSSIPQTMLYVYDHCNLVLTEEVLSDGPKIPEILDTMVCEPTAIKDRPLLKQCYTAIIYIMRYEVMLFKQYTFALCTKLDMIIERSNVLNNNIKTSLPEAEGLLAEVSTSIRSIIPEITPSEIMGSMNNLFDKIQTLYNTINEIKNDTDHYSQQMKEAFDTEQFLQNIDKYSKMYEEFLKMYQTFSNDEKKSPDYITDQVRVLSEVFYKIDEQKMQQLQDPTALKIIRQLVCFDEKIHYHHEVINSCIKLIMSYRNTFSGLLDNVNQSVNLAPEIPILPNMNVQPMVGNNIPIYDDIEIRDNIALRAAMDQYLQDIQQNWQRMNL